MKLRFFGGLRQKAGSAELEVEGATVGAVLAQACAGNQALRAAIFDGDSVRPHVRVLVNGHDCELAQGLDTAVSSQDQIAVFPPLAGG